MSLNVELIEILTYFNDGLKDVESGSGEEQPMQKRIEKALIKVKINRSMESIQIINGMIDDAEEDNTIDVEDLIAEKINARGELRRLRNELNKIKNKKG